MGGRKTSITVFLYDIRETSLTQWARKHQLSPQSVRNTICGIRPVIKVVDTMYQKDLELFKLLPQEAKDKLTPEQAKKCS